ncbi:MAG TPA: 2-oxoacid:acceptor oxidoreductase family protein [Candidatus Excrementavichristensenella intestinipullorum]|nr:2-oxoacid:acceptor oxidoreductase family protein [Candidatus Excrementavichristensenella intestinipullorum]
MEKRMIIAGFGGQGVLLIGQLIAYAGMLADKEVSWMPSYGPEMRGGSANCAVVVSDEPVASPKVEEADLVIAMNRPSMELFEKALVPGGVLIYNSSLIDVKPTRQDIQVVAVPCNDIANDLGSLRSTNMVMLGAYAGVTGEYSVDTLMGALRHKLGPSKEKFMPANQKAIEAGMAAVRG